jgi:hypothetical protein
LLGALLLFGLSGSPRTVTVATPQSALDSGGDWSAVPLAARGVISRGIGADDARFFARRAASGALVLDNQSQHLRGVVLDGRLTLSGERGLDVGLSSPAIGRGGALATVPRFRAASPERNRVTLAAPLVSEWLASGPAGVEQGFTLAQRPAGRGPLTISQSLSGDAAARVDAGRQSATFTSSRGSLRYGGLLVTDATGRRVPAHLAIDGDRLTITVNDAHAAYPLSVDPEFQQVAELSPADGTTGDSYGEAIAVQGRTIVVGNNGAEVGGHHNEGAAYVYEEGSNGWAGTTLKAELTASDGTTNTELAHGVAISGSTIVLGTYAGFGAPGAAYVYTEPPGGWENATQTAELTASDGINGDGFGNCVAIAGSTIAVSAPDRKSHEGALYVFTEPSGGWADATQTAELTASDGAASDDLGYSIAMSGKTVIAGAEGDRGRRGAIDIFTEPAGGWIDGTQTAQLTASGAQAGEELGYSVGMSGSEIVGGAYGHDGERGAAYVFTEPAGGWKTSEAFAAELTAEDSEPGDGLGIGVAIYRNTVVAGASERNGVEGAAYVFTEPAGGWTSTAEPTAELTASNGKAGDEFGYTVADGGPIVIGALKAHGQLGSAYIFHPDVTSSTVDLALSPASIPADGHSTTTGTLTVKDTSGNPVAGESLALHSTNHQELFGPIRETTTPGTYSFTIVSSTTPGSATIAVSDTSVSPSVSASATLTETPLGSSSGTTTSSSAPSSAPAPSNVFTVTGQQPGGNGSVALAVKVPGAGTLSVLGTHENVGASASSLLEPGPHRFDWGRTTTTSARAGVVKLTLHPSAAGKHLLLRHRTRGWALHVRFWVTYTPAGGTPRSVASTVRVLAARKR